LRLASGLVLFTYIAAHLANHALGLVSVATAEAGLEIAVEVWDSWPGTVLLYGAAVIHFLLALWSVYERRTFRLPPLELLRIALGFTLPILLIGHAANTRLAYELFGMPSDYTRVVANLWLSDSQGMQLGLLAPGWLHGCLGLPPQRFSDPRPVMGSSWAMSPPAKVSRRRGGFWRCGYPSVTPNRLLGNNIA
jgi:adenylate cyclase